MRLTIWQVLAFPALVFCTLAYGDVRIASWNIENLGWNNDKSLHAVARVASQYDFLAIQELMRPEAAEALADKLSDKTGEPWEAIYSESLGRGTYQEHYAFLWRQQAVEYVDGAVVYLDDRDLFAREPFSARFRVRETDMVFAAATIHVLYGDRVSDRTPEVQALADYWRWLEEIYPEDRDRILLLGDFNLPPDHSAWSPMLELAEPLITEGATTLSPQDRHYANLYDNILLPLEHGFGIIAAGIDAFPESLTDTGERYWSHQAARNHVSDHAPVYLLVGSVEARAMRSGPLRVPNWQRGVAVEQGKLSEEVCIDLNTASTEELQRIPHIGPERAKELVHGRPWSELSEVKRVPGIGPTRLNEIRSSALVCE
ncbi:helix-hairpin-helix domain-containing protein [Natronospira bacteriovora]|uniref:Helix-hairpin-helix domain-containing protein n=1 Tax=Natronospira bacteriovora TaxID=3069753 RepID=A0ABU0W742_9GAMM|nr:endonuclease/exonuclease/phosphatase family protein [Natronospira sp. AB-CW4]MDQ2069826.1 helix-hairpin-helix domain-containing protein [Natronospira sp. AB-CW4]